MQVTVNTPTKERKLVAVVSSDGQSLFVRNGSGGLCQYLTSYGGRGLCAAAHPYSLEATLAANPQRTAVYEGDSVTLQF